MYICIGKAASTGNAAGLRYQWVATSSNSNLMGFEFYGKGTKLWVYENGNGGVAGTWQWTGTATGSINGNAGSATTIKVNSNATTKSWITGTSTTLGNASSTINADPLVYLTTTSGQLSAKSYSVNDGTNEKVRLEWNATDQSLDFIFA